MDSELKELMESLKREIATLRDLVKAKDDLIQTLRFAPAPMIPQLTLPYVQPVYTPYQIPQPPFIVTSSSIPGKLVCEDTISGSVGEAVDAAQSFLSLVKKQG